MVFLTRSRGRETLKLYSLKVYAERSFINLMRMAVIGVCFSILNVASADDDDGLIFNNPVWHFVDGIEGLVVHVDDQIDDGCWARPKVSETQVSLELIRHGYKILENGSDEALFVPDIWIAGLGYADAAGVCIVTLQINVYAIDTRRLSPDNSGIEISALYNTLLWSNNYVLSGSKDSMNQRIADAHAEIIRKFLLDLEKNSNEVRKEILETVPENRKAVWRSYLSE